MNLNRVSFPSSITLFGKRLNEAPPIEKEVHKINVEKKRKDPSDKMRHRELWVLVVDILESYFTRVKLTSNVTTLPPEDHLEEHLQDEGPLSANEASFVRQCVLGVIRHQPAVDGALCGFCDALKRNKQDRLSMYLIAYLMIFRYDELGGRFIRSLIDQSTSNIRLAEYLGYLLDRDMLEKFGVPHWTLHYDDVYVREFLIGNLMKKRQEASREVHRVYLEKATNAALSADDEGEGADDQMPVPGLRGESPKRKVTIAVAPRLSVGGTRLRDLELAKIPQADVREMIFTIPPEKPPRVTPVPDGTIPLTGLRAAREPTDYKMNPFVQTDRPTNIPQLLKEKAEREEKLLLPDPAMRNRIQPGEVRAKLAAPEPVRTTAATVRREQQLYKRRDEERLALLRKKEIEMRDDAEFQAWKKKEEEKSRTEREALIAERKLLMMLADEEAKAAKLRQEEQNQDVSRQFRSEMKETRSKFEQEKEEERRQKLRFATDLRQELAQQVEIAVAHVASAKKSAASELKAEKQVNEQRVAIQLELDRERKVGMIQEIKRIHAESVAMRSERIEKRRNEANAVDIGAIATMSYAELQEKLAEVRKEQSDLEAERRENIMKHRAQQRTELQEMQAQCEAERRAYLDDKERQRMEKKRDEAAHAEQMRIAEEQRLVELQAKLQEKRDKRKEQERLRKEAERERKLSGQLLAGDASAVEWNNWRELERGQQNKILSVQNSLVRHRSQERMLRKVESDVREMNIATTASQRTSRRQMSDEMLSTKKATAEMNSERDRSVLKTALDLMREEKAMMRTRTA